jgi:predicted amidohydrolase YtcJ
MRPRPADLIYRDTPIIVGDPRAAPARFLAVRDARVVAVGPVDETSTWAGPRTRVLSQPNGAILPGFVDAHLHFASAVRLGPKPCPFGPAELPTRLAQARAAAPPGAWLFLAGYDSDPTDISRAALDQLVPDHPVVVRHVTGHAAVLNGLALRRLGWLRRYPDGRVVGRLHDIARAVPPGSGPAPDAVATCARSLLQSGVTSFIDATATNTPEDWRRLSTWQAAGLVPQTVGMLFDPERVDLPWLKRLPPGRRFGLKVVLEPTGLDAATRRRLLHAAELARRAARPLAVHVADLEALAFALEVLGSLPARPYVRLEHVGLCPPALVPDVRQVAAAVVTQPAFLYWRGDRYRREVDPAAWSWLYPAAALMDAGIPLAVSSDAPVAPAEPLAALAALVARLTRDGVALGPPTPVAALRLLATVTAEAASIAGMDAGLIRPGRPADLVEVEPNPLALCPTAWDTIRVRRVFLQGREVLAP